MVGEAAGAELGPGGGPDARSVGERRRAWYSKRDASSMPSPALTSELKALLVSELNLVGKDPQAIADDAPLFGDGGLGLDSLDALEIAMLVEERFGVRVPEGDEARPAFRSVRALAEFIERSERAV